MWQHIVDSLDSREHSLHSNKKAASDEAALA
jgi:hypothetical protein